MSKDAREFLPDTQTMLLLPFLLLPGFLLAISLVGICGVAYIYGQEFYQWIAQMPVLGWFARLCHPLVALAAAPTDAFSLALLVPRLALSLTTIVSVA
ncbi:hypothetical protein KDH83_31930, partial [Achromobacter sp. Marseille-Q0513]|uniref:hypothetical protein n=1 Tax=Achromobacter sp. Marseille-Q0513 TaxID=2829161 RepID=UPI001B90F6DE